MLTFQTNKDKDLELSLFKRSVSYLFSYLCSYNENLTIKKLKIKANEKFTCALFYITKFAKWLEMKRNLLYLNSSLLSVIPIPSPLAV